MKKLLLFCLALSLHAQQGAGANPSVFAGLVDAWAYAYGVNPVVPPLTVDSAITPTQLRLHIGTIALSSGVQFMPFSTNAPIIIGSGATQEIVTPTVVNCKPLNCSITAPFVYSHGQGDTIRSGTFGLQEAINAAAIHGGSAVLSGLWSLNGGTTAIYNAAVVPGNVSIVDNRTGLTVSPGSVALQTAVQGTAASNVLRDFHSVKDATFSGGAKCDVLTITDASMTNGSAVIASAGQYVFTAAADNGKLCGVPGAGANGGPLTGTITVTGGVASLSSSASTSVSPGTLAGQYQYTTGVGATCTASTTQAVTFSGGGGTGGAGTITIGSGGYPTGYVTITNGGSGYTSAPTQGTIATCTGTANFKAGLVGGTATFGTNDKTPLDAAMNSGFSLVFPVGGCVYNNTAQTLFSSVANQQWTSYGQTTIWLTNQGQGAWAIDAPKNFSIDRITFQNIAPPVARIGTTPFYIRNGTNVSATNISVIDPSSQGMVFYNNNGIRFNNLYCKNSLADCFDFYSNQNESASNLVGDGSGDDTVEIINTIPGVTYSLGTFSNLKLSNSAAKCIALDGAVGTVITGGSCDGSGVQGIQVYSDATAAGNVPDDNLISNFDIKHTGQGQQSGNADCIEIDSSLRTHLNHIVCDLAGTNPLSGANGSGLNVNSATASVWLNASAFSNTNALGVNVQAANYFWMHDSDVSLTNSTGVGVVGTTFADLANITARDTSLTNTNHRAFDLETNGTLIAGTLNITDDQATPTGFNFLTSGTTASALVGNLQSIIPHGTLGINIDSKTVVANKTLGFGTEASVASTTTIAPTTKYIFLTGNAVVTTITAPTNCVTSGQDCTLTVIVGGTGPAQFLTGGNIAFAYYPVKNQIFDIVYNPTTSFWYPPAPGPGSSYKTIDANRTSTLTPIVALTGLTGQFRLSINTASSSTVCTNTVTVNWTNKAGAQTVTAIAATATAGYAVVPVDPTTGNVTFLSTITSSCVGGSGFDTTVTAERLQ